MLHLDVVYSTNNYATAFVDADTAAPGLTVVARRQTGGRGQRGRHWADVPGQSLLLSMVVPPGRPLEEAPVFNAAVAAGIAETLRGACPGAVICVKWPNDLMIGDKKAGGILIENTVRGRRWTHAVVGVGINVLQESFPPDLPHATSLRIAGCPSALQPADLINAVRTAIWKATLGEPAPDVWACYNGLLYHRDQPQTFGRGAERWTALVRRVGPAGSLEVEQPDGTCEQYAHGSVAWVWPTEEANPL